MTYSTSKTGDLIESNSNDFSNQIGLLAEVSWEVCNKIGGIYAVLSTKARQLKEQFGDSLIFIGPDVWSQENPSPVFKEKKTLLKSVSSRLKLPWGITIRTGRWDIPGAPIAILVNPGATSMHLNDYYGTMWERYKVDSLHAYGDYDESCSFAIASSIVLKALAVHLNIKEERIMAHFDEWTTAMGLLNTQITMPEASTVFTTHATSIGRSICGNGKDLYQYFHFYNGDQMASELNMQSKHSLEKAAAHAADCFTTVSEVTARECEQLLEIRPQVVTPNGFEPGFVPKTTKYNKLRRDGRDRLLSIAHAISGKSYDDDTFMIATSGRNEYRNKGLDLFIDSMVSLEERLPADKKTVVFIFVPAWVKEPNNVLLNDMKSGTAGTASSEFLTHRLHNEDTDSICCRIRSLKAEGKFKKIDIIFVPSYLDGNDGVVNIVYYDLLPSLDLTLFPSYYEPWGYTPLESCAFGVPTITTNKAGFGQWVLDNLKNGLRNSGVMVIDRQDTNYQEAVRQISGSTLEYVSEDSKERTEARHAAFLTAEKADWNFFIKYYDEAFRTALSRCRERICLTTQH